MLVIDTKDINLAESTNDPMVEKGPVFRSLVVDGKTTGGYSAAIVKYNAGTKLNWHTHDSEQIIYATEGKGILATNKEEHVVTPGMLVVVPAGEIHYHGATKDSSFTHIAFFSGSSKVVSK
jgi:quercetin dioxygenase-like cupin family protein